MEEDIYRDTYRQVNHQRCVFEKMVLLRYGKCEHNQKILLAEREAMACKHKPAQEQCQLLLDRMRQNARFSLQLTQANQPLPHAKEVKVQVGGLFGLQQYLAHADPSQTEILTDDKLKFDNENSQPIPNIYAILQAALNEFEEIEKFPYNEMVIAINHFNIPPRKRKKRKK